MAPFVKSRLSLLKPTAPTDSSRYLKAPKPTRHTFQRKTKKKLFRIFQNLLSRLIAICFCVWELGVGHALLHVVLARGPWLEEEETCLMSWRCCSGGDRSQVFKLGGLRPLFFRCCCSPVIVHVVAIIKNCKKWTSRKGKKGRKKLLPFSYLDRPGFSRCQNRTNLCIWNGKVFWPNFF